MIISLPNDTIKKVQKAESDGDYEGAVESVFEFAPHITRDDAVDTVEATIRGLRATITGRLIPIDPVVEIQRIPYKES